MLADVSLGEHIERLAPGGRATVDDVATSMIGRGWCGALWGLFVLALSCSGKDGAHELASADASMPSGSVIPPGGATPTAADSNSEPDDERAPSTQGLPGAESSVVEPGEARSDSPPDDGQGASASESPEPAADQPGAADSDTPVEASEPTPQSMGPALDEPTPAPTEPTEPAESEPDDDTDAAPDSPAPGEYETRAELLAPNSEMAVAELDGRIYVVGGYPSSRETQDTVQVYDTTTDEWALAAPVPEPIHHPVLVGTAGKLYSLGGQPDTARSLVYDPGLDAWSDIAPMPTARGAGAGAAIGEQIFVVGGRPPAANAFEVYTISTDTWAELPPLPRDYDDRNHLAAVAIDGRIYVAGGRYDGGGFSSPMTDALDVYDPETDEWSRAASMLRPRGGVNGVVANGCFHVFGGEGTNTGEPNDVFPDHDVYDPTTDTWERLAPLPTPVHGVTGAAFVGGLIYMPGGGTSSGGSSGSTVLQVYRPDKRCDGS